MADLDLDAIRKRHERYVDYPYDLSCLRDSVRDVSDLLAEVERLRETDRQVRKVVNDWHESPVSGPRLDADIRSALGGSRA